MLAIYLLAGFLLSASFPKFPTESYFSSWLSFFLTLGVLIFLQPNPSHPKGIYTLLGLCFGIGSGLFIGFIYADIALGFIIGMVSLILGLAIGIELDKKRVVEIQKHQSQEEIEVYNREELKLRLKEAYYYIFLGALISIMTLIGTLFRFSGMKIDPLANDWIFVIGIMTELPGWGLFMAVLLSLIILLPSILLARNLKIKLSKITP